MNFFSPSQVLLTGTGYGKAETLDKRLTRDNHGLYNFKFSNTRKLRRAVANVRAGISNGKIVCVGDSTTAGNIGSGASGFDGARPKTPPKRMAEILSASGIPAQEVGIFGGAGLNNAQYPTYDTRVTLNSGWLLTAPNSIGGNYYANTTNTAALAFAPGISFDTIEYWYANSAPYNQFTVDIGASAVDTAPQSGAFSFLKRTVSGLSLAASTINFKRSATGTEARISGVTVYNSAVKILDIFNVGVSGAVVDDWNQTGNAMQSRSALVALAADVYIIDIGINDFINLTAVSTFKSTYQSIITALTAVGDVILCTVVPRDITATAAGVQFQYMDAVRQLADANDLPLIDHGGMLESYEIGNPLGLYSNGTHLSVAGYAQKGALLADAVRLAA